MNMKIIKKPDEVSFDEVAEVLHDAHRSNQEKGMIFPAGYQSGEELREHLGETGTFYLAYNDKNDLCAVGALKYRYWNKWFCKGVLCGDILSVGVRQRYKGMGISKKMFLFLEEEAFRHCDLVTMNTAEHNTIMLESRLHDGWRYVDFLSHDGTNFYSIMLAKWNGHPQYSARRCREMFLIRKLYTTAIKRENGDLRPWSSLVKKVIKKK